MESFAIAICQSCVSVARGCCRDVKVLNVGKKKISWWILIRQSAPKAQEANQHAQRNAVILS
jgi:hypothetical protein